MLEIVGVWIKRAERVTVLSRPGDPDLIRLLKSGWDLDWKDGGLHPSGNEPRMYSLVREIRIRDDATEQTLVAELLSLSNNKASADQPKPA